MVVKSPSNEIPDPNTSKQIDSDLCNAEGVDELPPLVIEKDENIIIEDDSAVLNQNYSTDADISDQLTNMAKNVAFLNHQLALKNEVISKLKEKNTLQSKGLKNRKNLRRIKSYYEKKCRIFKAKYRVTRKITIMDLVRRNETLGDDVKTFIGLMFRKRYFLKFKLQKLSKFFKYF